MAFPFAYRHFLLLVFTVNFLWLTPSFAVPTPSSGQTPTRVSRRQDTNTACAALYDQTDDYFPAKIAYDCLISVPFNQTVATQLIQYYSDTLQFQSTLAYLKNPPPTYKQPAVDLLQGLADIQDTVNSGGYQNEYDFEADIQKLVYAAHDTHLSFNGGATSVFSFSSPYSIIALSPDGVAVPKVYIAQDFVPLLPRNDYTPSAIATINGQPTTDFLTQFAASNSFGALEPHGDWNTLMFSSAADVQGLGISNAGFTNTPFYPGEDITLTFENGSVIGPTPWLVTAYPGYVDLSEIYTGDDFYDAFVVFSAFSAEESSVDLSQYNFTDYVTPTTWANDAYPAADVYQPGLGSDGYVTGYFLNDSQIGVLSIPNFFAQGDIAQQWSDTIAEFLSRSKIAGMKKIVVDLQQNNGGTALLATDAFKQFFPTIDPFGGSRFRANTVANVLGTTITNFYDSLSTDDPSYPDWAASYFSADVYLNPANGSSNFTTWAEYYGPNPNYDDMFSSTARKNLSSAVFDFAETDGGITIYGYADRPATAPQPYAAADIILLTDSLCVSTCALFVEMMHHEAGVRTVVVGGRPEAGPMQAVNGAKGAAVWDNESLDETIDAVIEIDPTVASVMPNRTYEFNLIYAGLNFRDQIRNGEYTPLQFEYEPADCRIYFTSETVNNYVNLWSNAADAIWKNSTMCVTGSTDPSTVSSTGGVGATAAEQSAWTSSRLSPPFTDSSAHDQTDKPTLTFQDGYPNDGDDGVATAIKLGKQGCASNPKICNLDQVCKTDIFFSIATGKQVGKLVECKNECSTDKASQYHGCKQGFHCTGVRLQAARTETDQVFWEENLCKKTCKHDTDCATSTATKTQKCVTKNFCDGANKGRPAAKFCLDLAKEKSSHYITQCVQSVNAVVLPLPTSAAHTPQVPDQIVDAGTRSKEAYMGDGTMGGTISAGWAPWESELKS